ncbi:MAG: UDP-2,4-diacetamido-2,4,6-trideoxy-beta-L-altropyranose hydrolase [Bacteroidota bacterium]|nr:UDP-2,4-diacetamido-2,4,6-trideoxy-beta-L-altropyranose hydrolase [Bacteroidota bacterium]
MVSICFRADGSREIGLGHLIRIAAIKSYLAKNSHYTFTLFTKYNVEGIDLGINPEELIYIPQFIKVEEEPAYIFENQKSDIVIIDGYSFNNSYFKHLKNLNCKVVCIKDFVELVTDVDVIINHAPGLTGSSYLGLTDAQVFTGLNYAMLRPEFLFKSQDFSTINDKKTLTIILGGSDINNYTGLIISNILGFNLNFKINAVCGIANPNIQLLREFESENVSILLNLSGAEIKALYQTSDLIIASPSTSAIEVCAVGKPLGVIKTIENQALIYRGLISDQLAFDLGTSQEIFNKEFRDLLYNYLTTFDTLNYADNQLKQLDSHIAERFNKIIEALC